MGGRAFGIGREEALTLPTRIGVVDAPIHALGVIAHRVGNAHDDPFPVHQSLQRVGLTGRRDRYVLAEAQRILLVDPHRVRRFGGCAYRALGKVFELWAWQWIEMPAFRANILCVSRNWAVQLALAHPAIEARRVAAREREPDDAIACDAHAARTETGHRGLRVLVGDFIILGELGLR